jgi:fucose permease
VLAFGLLLFFESGNEFILSGYTSTFLIRELHSSVSHASFLLALYWASVIAARLALSRLLLAVEGGITIMASAVAAAAGVGLLSIARTEWMAAGALILTGCGVASIFPTTLGLAGTRFSENSGAVFGLLFAMALTGGMSLPWSLGHFAGATGLRLALLLPACGFLAIFVIQATLIGRQSTPPAPE